MVTGKQIRAARALLDWSAEQLAKQVGLSRESINKIEDGSVQPRAKNLADIVRVFDEHGLEFTDHSGVRFKPQGVEILYGREGLQRFFDGVYEHAKRHGGEIMMFGIDETTFIQNIGNEFSQDYLRRMAAVSQSRGDLKVLAIICEGDTNFCAAAYNEYRWISKDVFQAVPFYIYGETLAVMDFNAAQGPMIMLLKSRAVTNAYRKQFQAFWKMTHPPVAESQGAKT